MPAEKETPVADALRKAGYVCLPRLWVKPSDMPSIHKIASKHRDAVNDIRGQANSGHQHKANPLSDKDAAWAAYEKMRGS